MICPKCRVAALHRVRTERPLGIWRCPSCAGVWVPQGRAAEVEPPSEVVASALGSGDADERTGLCPEGHGLLARARADLGSHEEAEFYVERCGRCFGVWFDDGEWQAVAAAELADGLWALWDPAWQRARRHAREAASEWAHVESELGADLALQLRELAGTLRTHPKREAALRFLHRELTETGARLNDYVGVRTR